MLGEGRETPSRYELLNVVKKHSNLLGQTTVDEQDASDVEMDYRFWRDVMNLYFVLGRESRRQDDDLIFFVRKMSFHGHGANDNLEDNSLTLYAGGHLSHQALQNHQSGETTSLSPIYKVVKTVYASPSRVNFHLDSRKEVETTPAYPDICFAVDDFDSTFDAVVLTNTDHCYCVLLNANGGAAFPDKKTSQDCSSSDNSSITISTHAGKTNKTKLTLFSGFVSYQMVREAYDAGRSGFGSLLSLGHSSGKTDKLYMKGPGGRGEVLVAVSGVLDQSMQGSSPHSPGQSSKKVSGFGEIVRRAANVASVAAKHAYAAAGTSRNSDNEMLPLKCCLMSISLPWECIAHDLLLKGSPPVNL